MIESDARELIQEAIDQGVSDIHLLPQYKEYQLYFRINGKLVPIEKKESEWCQRLISYFKFLANMEVGEKRKPQSGATYLDLKNERVELRFSTITNVKLYESIVIRVLRQVQSSLGDLHVYFSNDLCKLKEFIRRKSGLVLFSGPVGSGKTTTIYQLLRDRMTQEEIQVITMEDPVEIYEERFLQTEVNIKAGITYDMLIKSSLRHHPDILMIGEIRDEITARMVIRGALTGHLMIATIHAKNTLGVLARLEELKVTRIQLEQTLIGVVSQRLVPKYCYSCHGTCQINCKVIENDKKRAAIFEVLTDKELKYFYGMDHLPKGYPTLNDRLRKAWLYGYIDKQTYTHFEVV